MSMQDYCIENMYDLSQTIAADLFAGKEYPWEVLGDISDFIVKLGNTLPADRFEKRGENVWVAKSAKIFDSAYIDGPCIIDEEAEIRQCAFIRGSAIVGKKAVVGNSTELKNVVLFDLVQVPTTTTWATLSWASTPIWERAPSPPTSRQTIRKWSSTPERKTWRPAAARSGPCWETMPISAATAS